MQIAAAAGVLVQIDQREARAELAAQLLLHRVGELNAAVVGLKLRHLLGVFERIEGEGVDDAFLVVVEHEGDAVVQPAEQRAALLQHAIALAEDRLDRLHIAVRYGMHDEIERFIRKGQRLRHVGAHDVDGIALARGHDALAFELAGRIIEHGAARAHRREQGHLLPAAAGQPQHALALYVAQPCGGHGLCGREED